MSYPNSKHWVRKHLGRRDVDALQKCIGDASVQKKTTSVKTRKEFWEENWRLTDDLRLILWIYLREAFDLPGRLTASTRGADALAIELAAAAIHAADPPSLNQDGKKLLQHWDWREGPRGISLTDVVVPMLDNLLAIALEGGAGQVSGHEKTDGLPGREMEAAEVELVDLRPVMARGDEGDVPLLDQIHDRGQHPARGDGVEGGGRLVGDNDRRPVR